MTDTIEVSTLIEAPVATVFAYFADPARFSRWFEHGSSVVPGLGGRFEFRSPNGPPASGRIEAWEPNRLVQFRFGHPEGSGLLPPESSTVRVTFAEVPGGTRVTLLHSGIEDSAMRRGAGGGWQAGLTRLASAVWRDRADGMVDDLVATWTQAWSELDAQRRLELLGRCCADSVSYRDMFARIDGRSALSEWIGGVQAMMPGARVEPTGPAVGVQGHLSWPWRIVGGDGKSVGRGRQYMALDQNLQCATAVGFWDPTAP